MTKPKKFVPKSRSPAQQAVSRREKKNKNSKKATCQVGIFQKKATRLNTRRTNNTLFLQVIIRLASLVGISSSI